MVAGMDVEMVVSRVVSRVERRVSLKVVRLVEMMAVKRVASKVV